MADYWGRSSHYNYFGGGGGYGWSDYDPVEEARRRAAELQALRDEQLAIDSAPTTEERIKMNRQRITKPVVEVCAIERWDAALAKLSTTVDTPPAAPAAPAAAVPRPWWAKAPVVVTDADRKQRFEPSPKLNAKVALIQADITTLGVDAIVNAANGSLLGGGGIDGAIHKAAGDLLVEECRPLKGCNVGSAKMTRGYRLPARYVIHTVGPMGSGDAELASCYEASLELFLKGPLSVAGDDPLRSIALCGISTGIYGFPLVPATHIAFDTTRVWLEALSPEELERVDLIVFCVFTDEELSVYKSLMPAYFPPPRCAAEPIGETDAEPVVETD